MGQVEKGIENQILNYLSARGIYCFKIQTVGIYDSKRKAYRKSYNPYHRKGVSDILGVLPDGTFFAIEVKVDKTLLTEKTYPSKEQKEFIADINKNFGIAFVARNIEDVRLHLKDYLHD